MHPQSMHRVNAVSAPLCPAYGLEQLSAHQQNAIQMAFRWWANSCSRLYAAWGCIN